MEKVKKDVDNYPIITYIYSMKEKKLTITSKDITQKYLWKGTKQLKFNKTSYFVYILIFSICNHIYILLIYLIYIFLSLTVLLGY